MPKIPKPPAGYEYMGRKLGPKKLKRPVAGRDTRPTEMMPRRNKTMGPVPMPRKPKRKP